MIWLSLMGCGGAPKDCVFPIEQWCTNNETEGGPTGTGCTDPTVADLLTEPYSWHGQCETDEHGTLGFVVVPGPYGDTTYYFDPSDTLVAYLTTTDFAPYCDETSYDVAYGLRPTCTSRCTLQDVSETGDTGLFTDTPPPC